MWGEKISSTNFHVKFGPEMYFIHLNCIIFCKFGPNFDLNIVNFFNIFKSKLYCSLYISIKFQLLLGAPLRDLPIHLLTTYIGFNAAPPTNF